MLLMNTKHTSKRSWSMSGFMKKIELKGIEEAREKFISGGGLVAADMDEQKSLKVEDSLKLDEWIKINLRIKKDAVTQIDKFVSSRMGVTRTGWILEAIQEKLKKEMDESRNSF